MSEAESQPPLRPGQGWLISSLMSKNGFGSPTPDTEGSPGFHHNFISFLTAVQHYEIDLLPISWRRVLENAGPGATGQISQRRMSSETNFIFKHSSVASSSSHGWEDTADERRSLDILVSELTILSHPLLRYHQNIVNVEGICFEVQKDGRQVWPVLVLEEGQLGDLNHFMKTEPGKSLSLEERMCICADVASALVALHGCHGMHGDIKPGNIFMYKDRGGAVFAKLADFGHSVLTEYDEDVIVWPPRSRPWDAPEYHHRGFRISDAQTLDIYSFGMVCLWILFHDRLCQDPLPQLETLRGRNGSMSFTKRVEKASRPNLLEELKREDDLRFLANELINTTCGLTVQRQSDLALFFNSSLTSDPKRRILAVKQLASLLDKNWYALFHRNSKCSVHFLMRAFGGRIPGPSTTDSLRPHPVYSDFRLSWSFRSLMRLDYRLRKHVVSCLEEQTRSNIDPSNHIYPSNAAFQLAFCYHIGFGVPMDRKLAEHWCRVAAVPAERLDRELKEAKMTLNAGLWRNGNLIVLRGQGYFPERNYAEDYQQLQILYQSELEYQREIQDMESVFGKRSRIVDQQKMTLAGILQASEKYDQMEAMTLEQLEVYLEDGGSDPYRIHYDLSSFNQSKDRETANLGIRVPQFIPKATILNRIVVPPPDSEPAEIPQWMAILATIYMDQNRWHDAEWILALLRLRQIRIFEEENPRILRTISGLAECYLQQGRWKESERLIEYVTGISNTVLGAEHVSTLNGMVNLARSYRNKGNLKDAEKLILKVIDEQKEVLREIAFSRGGPAISLVCESSDVESREQILLNICRQLQDSKDPTNFALLNTLQLLASIYTNQARFKEADNLFRRLLDVCKQTFPPNRLGTLSIMHDFAVSLARQNRWNEAKNLMVHVVETQNLLLGVCHGDSLASTNALAVIYSAEGRLAEAEKLLLQVVVARKNALGPLHNDTLIAELNLASIYRSLHRLGDAKPIIERVVSTRTELFGAEHPDTLAAMAHLAATRHAEGQVEEAKDIRVVLVETQKRVLGIVHPETLITMKNLAHYHARLHQRKEAEELWLEVINAERSMLGPQHHTTLKSTAQMYTALGRGKEAETLCLELARKHEKELGVEHPSTIDAQWMVGDSLWLQGRWCAATRWRWRAWRWRATPTATVWKKLVGILSKWKRRVWLSK